MMRFIAALSVLLICAAAHADECASYKLHPSVSVAAPSWSKEVVQPLDAMDLWHGNVIATLVDNYDIVADITSIEDGFCVGLKSVAATIGYSDFMVRIDMRHTPGTCSYDAVLSHEDEHIRAYLSVIDDYMDMAGAAVSAAAESVMPVFVGNSRDIDAAVEQLNNELQSHPELILIKQKIRAAEEIRNRHIDQADTGANLRRCFE